jgi:RNA polymerase sigma factor (sigma-70 family)
MTEQISKLDQLIDKSIALKREQKKVLEEIKTEIRKNKEILEPREEIILRRRFCEGLTLVEVGKEFGVTNNRIRQLQCKGLERIRKYGV